MKLRPCTAAGPRRLPKYDLTDAKRREQLEAKAAEVRRMMEGEKVRKREPAA